MDIKSQCVLLYHAVTSAMDPSSTHLLSDIFFELPQKEALPTYYVIIEKVEVKKMIESMREKAILVPCHVLVRVNHWK